MRRADRLFQIIQVLRRTRKPLTADAIAAELETSKRTIYRDITTLIEQRVPIRGEAGVGYILKGIRPAAADAHARRDRGLRARRAMGGRPCRPALARAAQDLMAKVAETVPERLRPFVLEPASRAHRPGPGTRPHRHGADPGADPRRQENHAVLSRRAWPRQRAHHLADRDRLPRGCANVAAWCELRKDFRSFRTDRVVDAEYHDEKYPERRDILRAKWRRSLVWEAPKDT